MECPLCHGAMALIDYRDTRGALPLVWIQGWRCDHCGFAINPWGEMNRRFLNSMCGGGPVGAGRRWTTAAAGQP
jgi:hypothetical protein